MGPVQQAAHEQLVHEHTPSKGLSVDHGLVLGVVEGMLEYDKVHPLRQSVLGAQSKEGGARRADRAVVE